MRYHVSTERGAAARGLGFGAAQRSAVQHTVEAYLRLFHDAHGLSRDQVRCHGQAVGDLLRAESPDLCDEIIGIATGADQDERELLAVNARTELLAGWDSSECSTVAVLGRRSASHHCLMAQNWDWYPELSDSLVCWTIMEPDGSWLTTLTEAGILAKIGLNSRGVGCCLNMLETTADGGVHGMPIHLLLRLILQRCSTTEDALRLLSGSTVSASSCVTVGSSGDGSEGLVCVELSPAGARTVALEAEGWLAHTNHFCVSPNLPDGHPVDSSPNSMTRLSELRRQLAGQQAEIAAADLRSLLRSHANAPYSICRHVDEAAPRSERTATLASVVMDLGVRQLWVSDGAPCCSPWLSMSPAVSFRQPTAPR